jgi:hypothetical protein
MNWAEFTFIFLSLFLSRIKAQQAVGPASSVLITTINMGRWIFFKIYASYD